MNEEQKAAVAALNIVNNKTNVLLSPHVPLIFDWNGEGDILSEIHKDSNFFNFLKENVFNIKEYSWAVLCFGYFSREGNDNKKDNFKDVSMSLQIEYSLEYLDKNGINLSEKYLIDIYKDLYKRAFNEDYVLNDKHTLIDNIVNIHNLIHAKYADQFLDITEINYVRSVLQKKFDLHDVQLDYLIQKITNIINEH